MDSLASWDEPYPFAHNSLMQLANDLLESFLKVKDLRTCVLLF